MSGPLAAAPADQTEAAARCLNCRATLVGPFCAQCGQRDHDLRVSWSHFWSEFAEDYLHFDSKLPRTLALLVTRPGELTRAFLEGRRVDFVGPFKLYVLCSLVFFLVGALLPKHAALQTSGTRTQMSAAGSELIAVGEKLQGEAKAPGTTADGALDLQVSADAPGWMRHLAERTRGKSSRELGAQVSSAFTRYLPDALLVLVPVVALLLKLLFRRRFLAEHFVTALHLQAFGFLCLLAVRLSPFAALRVLLFLGGLAFVVATLRRVYGEGWGRTLFKSGFALFSYAIVLALTVSTVALVGLMRA